VLATSTGPAGVTLPYREGTRVYATLPDGQRVAFTFNPEAHQIPGLAYYLPAWEAEAGVGWTLDSRLAHLQRAGDRFYDIATGLPYNPEELSGSDAQFVLTAPDGTQYGVSFGTGTSEVRFTDGVRWRVSDAGIAASNGDAVEFRTDDAGRIARVTLPDGREIAYNYDAAGDLFYARTSRSRNRRATATRPTTRTASTSSRAIS